MLRRSRGRSPSSQESEEEPSEWIPSKTLRKLTKGARQAAPLKWTRILKFEQFMDDLPSTFSIEQDLKRELSQNEDEQIQQDQHEEYIESFDQELKDIDNVDLTKELLEEAELRLFAEKTIIIRRSIVEKAKLVEELEMDEEDGINHGPPLKQIKLNRRFQNRRMKRRQALSPMTDEVSMDQRNLKRQKLYHLGLSDKISIVHKVKIQHMSYKETAYLHHVDPQLVAKLVKNSSQDPQYLNKMKKTDEDKGKLDEVVANVAAKLNESSEGIKRAEDVISELWTTEGIKVTKKKVCIVMREKLNLKYRPLKRIAFQANSVRCLIQRQRFAKSMIDLLLRGQVILNIDESWINLKDYSRFRWRERGVSNSSNIQTISPRISLITALSTSGEVYFSLTQVNTDSPVKCLFLKQLASYLDRDRPGWREDTVILMDNASYNKSDDTIKFIKKLGIRVMFSAAYSYDASPIERYFGYLKQGLIMQQGVPSGKLQVLIDSIILQIFPQHCIGSNQQNEGDEEECQLDVLVLYLPRAVSIFKPQKALKMQQQKPSQMRADGNLDWGLIISSQTIWNEKSMGN